MKRITLIFEMLMVVGCLSGQSCFTAVIRVPADQPTIQAGIDFAVRLDTILVADGVYSGEGNRDISFKGKRITVKSENGAERCIIDCMGAPGNHHRGFDFDSYETSWSILDGFTIKNGYADYGGGIYCSSRPFILNCHIRNNTALKCGGGIYSPGGAILDNCIISSNTAFIGGGGIYTCNGAVTHLTNCLIVSNYAEDGAGMYSVFFSSNRCTNCTLSHNVAGIEGCAIIGGRFFEIELTNCILWDNHPYETSIQQTLKSRYSIIKGGSPGVGNIDKNPLFIGGEPFDYRLRQNSPCIDAGTYDRAPEYDLDNNPRPMGYANDMGAYEFIGFPDVTRVHIEMPSKVINPGDKVFCHAIIRNVGNEMPQDTKLFVILDVKGSYWFAPGFISFDCYSDAFQNGLTTVEVIPEFEWPSGAGSASEIVWYAALTNPEMTELTSPIGVFDFGWVE